MVALALRCFIHLFSVRSVRDDLKSSIIKTQKSSVYITDMEIILATTPNICSYKF